jgi:hypothetical protein
VVYDLAVVLALDEPHALAVHKVYRWNHIH